MGLDTFINVALIKNPINWAIVFLMLALAASLLVLIVPTNSPSEN